MLQEQADAYAVGVGKVATAGGGAASGAYMLGLTANELAAFGGLIVAAIGVCIQWYFGRKRDKREQEYHQARLMWREDDGEG